MKWVERARENPSLTTILALAVAVRLYGIWWGLPEAFEEAQPLKTAWYMWGWGPDSSVDLNPHFFNYPSLVIYIQFALQGLWFAFLRVTAQVGSGLEYYALYVSDPTSIYILGRLVGVAFGVATVALVYRLGRRVGGERTAWIAAAAMALNPLHVSRSQMIEVDVALSFFTTLALVLALGVIEKPTWRLHLLAGVAIGLAASSKYTGAFVALPLVIAHLMTAENRGIAPLLASLALAGVVFLVTSPYVVLDSATFREHLLAESQHMFVGHFGVDEQPAWQFYIIQLGSKIIGWPALAMALAGAVLLAKRSGAYAITLLAFLIPYLISLSSWSMMADRYLLPTIPVLAILSAVAATAAWDWIAPRVRAPLAQTAIATAGLVVLLSASLSAAPSHAARLRKSARTMCREWIEQNIPSGTFFVTEAYGPHLFSPITFWELHPDIMKVVMEKEEDRPHFGMLPMPMFQVTPERSEAFYDISLYGMVDGIITSSSVRSRYLENPERFARQIAFYDSLEVHFRQAAQFTSRGSGDPTLTLYQNPDRTTPFMYRDPVAPSALRPERSKRSGGEELFFYNLGLNYEAYRHLEQAIDCYHIAMSYPAPEPALQARVVFALTRTLIDAERSDEAVEFLDALERAADTQAQVQQIEKLRGMLQLDEDEPDTP